MYIQFSLLFCATLASGLLIFAVPKKYTFLHDHILTLGGSYLFGLTLIHILPELFEHNTSNTKVGFWLLIGFSFQLLLDMLGGSIAHGHVPGHSISEKKATTKQRSSFTLLTCLFLHALLEGALFQKEGHTFVLIGMLLHKMPIAFTLASVLLNRKYTRPMLLLMLAIFAAATPLSFLLQDYFIHANILSNDISLKLHAMAVGGVFHIATTILFETNPHHQFNKTKWFSSLLGTVLAVGIDYIIPH